MAESEENILIIEDSPTLGLTYQQYLKPLKIKVSLAETGKEALEAISRLKPTVILLDLKLPDMDGIDILKQINHDKVAARVIVITAHGSVAVAVEAMREGASDFLLKPFTAERLTTTVNNALEISRLSNLVKQFSSSTRKKFGSFIGDSPAMQTVYRMIEDSAPSKASVFIMGPSGTGKEQPFTIRVNGRPGVLLLLIVRQSRKTLSKARFSAMSKAPSPALQPTGRVLRWRQMAAHCFWMKSAKCR